MYLPYLLMHTNAYEGTLNSKSVTQGKAQKRTFGE